eukprot:TRINITY_DN34187_c0_g1_i1.p1 TRINITY_DN34187_c0_g1~~TRINITY_DN34187_c0_g1_i1.p1  ORF type:complete len:372 (+),score=17.20 TRINITY_DN34187_c0_g1_i1:161-1276(+)
MCIHSKSDVEFRKLYWEDAAEDCQEPAVSREVFEMCTLTIISHEEFAANEELLKAVAKSIPEAGFAEVEWHKTRWTEKHLVEQCGYRRSGDSTILAVADGTGRYAIKYVYVSMDTESKPMRELSSYVFDDQGCVRDEVNPDGGLCGQSLVVRRGNKAMNHGSTMMMYGSWDCWDWSGATAKQVTQPRVYNPNGRLDKTLNSLLKTHADHLTRCERQMIPSYAAHRDRIAASVDRHRAHRISEHTTAFSVSLTSSYVISPHNDSGMACETIGFINRNGAMPDGHEWLFAIGGHVHPLPDQMGKSVILFIKGQGVYHGTLPTSSTEPTALHGNHGSALVTKKRIVDGLMRQAERHETTPSELTAATVFCAHQN